MAERKDAPAARPLLGTIGTIPRTVPLRAVFLSLAVFLSVKVQGPGTGRRKKGLDCGKKKKKKGRRARPLPCRVYLLRKVTKLTYFLRASQNRTSMLDVL